MFFRTLKDSSNANEKIGSLIHQILFRQNISVLNGLNRNYQVPRKVFVDFL